MKLKIPTAVELYTVIFIAVYSLYYMSDKANILGLDALTWNSVFYTNIYLYIAVLITSAIQKGSVSKYVGIPVIIWMHTLCIANILIINRGDIAWKWLCNSDFMTYAIVGVLLSSLCVSLIVKLFKLNNHVV